MKKLLLLTTIFTSCIALAQADIVAEGLRLPHQVAKHYNSLYVNNTYGFGPWAGEDVAKVNINTGEIEAMFSIGMATGLAVKDDYLYITGTQTKLLYRVNLTEATPTLETVFNFNTGEYNATPTRIIFVNDDLYVTGSSGDNGSGEGLIFKFTVDNISEPQVRTSGISVSGITELNGYLYFVDFYTNWMKRIGISAMHTDFSVGTIENYMNVGLYKTALVSYENKLYYSGVAESRIFTINTLEASPLFTVYETTENTISSLNVFDDKLYLSSQVAGTISTFYLGETLSTNLPLTNKVVTVYPNPTTDYIKVSGLTKNVDYKLYNVLGKKIIAGTLLNNDKINMQEFTNGLYLLKFSNGKTKRIIKK